MKKYDVVIVGAGLSGIGAAYHIQDKCPGKTFTVLEGRAAMGGTWDLFKYPGIRSDSDMYTLGFPFYPWKDPKAIADGPSILAYIKQTAKAFGIDKKIQYNHKVANADWSEEEKTWTLQIADNEDIEAQQIQCNFLFMCSGYYDYKNGYTPEFANIDAFGGRIIHPQKWDTSLNYVDKNVVIIGSGATAVTLVPEMSKKARKVTMLQRSPTYIMNLPREDKVANFFKKIMPAKMAHGLARWKNILMSLFLYKISKRRPEGVRKWLKKQAQDAIGERYNEADFDPKYDPWDQRLCLIPDNDLFDAIKAEEVDIVTDTIDQFTHKGIRLSSGKSLDADIVVTATGLKVQLFGGMKMSKDGQVIDLTQEHAYRGVMLSNVPNFAFAVGYTNASWTLKCDLNCQFVTRIIRQMDAQNVRVCVPRFDPNIDSEDLIDLNSSYVERAKNILPKQGIKDPWKVHQNYLKDLASLKYGTVKGEELEYF